MIRLT